MVNVNSIGNALGNAKFAKVAGGTAGAVYVMTGIKAVARPAFIYADKNSDDDTKKYSATKEFLYQMLCLGITVALIPFFKSGGLKVAEKYMKKAGGVDEVLADVDKASFVKKAKVFNDKLKAEKAAVGENGTVSKGMLVGHGGIEAGSFVGSILGLTLLAPFISDIILHPIMKTLGLEKNKAAAPKKVDANA